MTDPTERIDPTVEEPTLHQPPPTTTSTSTSTSASTRSPAPTDARTHRDTRPRRPRIMLSARVRILAWVALLLAFAGASALLLQRRVLHDRLDERIEDDLTQEVDEVRRLAQGRDPETGEPFNGDAAAILETFLRRNIPAADETMIALVEGQPPVATPAPYELWEDAEQVERWSALTTSERGEISTPEGDVRYLAVPLASDGEVRGVFVVAFFLDGPRQEIASHLRVGSAIYGGVLLVALALAWLIAGRVLAPVRSVTETAQELSATDLSRRIDVPTTNDEVAELARTFNDMLDRLDGAFANQRRFLDDAGHELRTPITIIRGHVELESDDPEERRATRAVVLDELDRMARIVGDLLVLARAERPDFLQPEAVDLDLLTSDLFAKSRSLADRDWRLAGTGLGIVEADPQRLTQAVMNLADNAVRHTAPGDTIEIGSALSDGEARLWVRDTGPGIPADQQDQIFERFARTADGARRPGTAGLGLAIVRGIARAHGGRVALDSRPGAGSTFTVAIPADCPDEIDEDEFDEDEFDDEIDEHDGFDGFDDVDHDDNDNDASDEHDLPADREGT